MPGEATPDARTAPYRTKSPLIPEDEQEPHFRAPARAPTQSQPVSVAVSELVVVSALGPGLAPASSSSLPLGLQDPLVAPSFPLSLQLPSVPLSESTDTGDERALADMTPVDVGEAVYLQDSVGVDSVVVVTGNVVSIDSVTSGTNSGRFRSASDARLPVAASMGQTAPTATPSKASRPSRGSFTGSMASPSTAPSTPVSTRDKGRFAGGSGAGSNAVGGAGSRGPGAGLAAVSVIDEHLSENLIAVVPEARVIFSCGHWDHSLRATNSENGQLLQCKITHTDIVSCLAHAKDFGRHWLVTGSRDCTLMVWEVYPDREVPLGSHPRFILHGHDDAVSTVAVSTDFGIIVSGSDDGTIIVHNLHSGVYVRSIVVANANPTGTALGGVSGAGGSAKLGGTLTGSFENLGSAVKSSPKQLPQHQHNQPCRRVSWVGISREAYIVAYCADDQLLITYSINGALLATKRVPERLHVNAISEDGKVLLSGGDACLVVMRWVSFHSEFFSISWSL